MDLQESTLYDLGVKATQNVAQYHPHHVTYGPVNFEVAMSNGLGEDAFSRKFIIWPWLQRQGHMKCCLVPSTSCDLCTCKILKLLLPKVYEEMSLQENTYDLWPWPWGQGHMKCRKYPLHHVIYACTRLKLLRPKFRRRYNYKKCDTRTDGRTTDRLWYEINIPYFSNEKAVQ